MVYTTIGDATEKMGFFKNENWPRWVINFRPGVFGKMGAKGACQSEAEKSLKGRWVGRTERAPWNRPGAARPTQNEAVPASDVNLCGKFVDFWWITCGKLNFLVENSENVEKVSGKCGKLAQKDQKMWITCGKVVDNSVSLLENVEKWWVFGGLDV